MEAPVLSTPPHFLQAQPLGAICRRLSAASELNLCASVMLGSAFDADWMRVNAAEHARRTQHQRPALLPGIAHGTGTHI